MCAIPQLVSAPLNPRWKCDKNKKVAHEAAKCVTYVLTTFWHFSDLLLNRCTATWNLVVLYNNMEKCEQNLALFSSRNERATEQKNTPSISFKSLNNSRANFVTRISETNLYSIFIIKFRYNALWLVERACFIREQMHGQMKAGQFLFLLRRFDEFHPKNKRTLWLRQT